MNEPKRRAVDVVDAPPPAHERSAKLPAIIALAIGAALVLAMALFVRVSVAGAGERLAKPEAAPSVVAVADDSEEKYCTPAFKQVLERVIHACGLVGGDSRRGCQPADVKTFASISDADFNALFTPLKDRGAVIMFDESQDKLDANALKLLDE